MQDVHLEFVTLVESLLENYVTSLGTDTAEFVSIVEQTDAADRERLLRSIDAMSDFHVFVGMVHDTSRAEWLDQDGLRRQR